MNQHNIKQVQTTCSYCGAGCQMQFTVDETANKIIDCKPLNGRTNEGKLCLKGHYGWDFLNDPQILTKRLRKPLMRKRGRNSPLEEAEWSEVIPFVAKRLSDIKRQYGADAIMGTGSARGSGNEANYLMQKFMRACIGTNNIDHCARICHAASVAGCMQTIGEGAMSLSVPEIENAEVILNFGYNAAASHPLVARRIIKAREKGAKIICVDPRVTETARISDYHLQIKGGTNLALANALANVILAEGLEDRRFIEEHTKEFEAFRAIVAAYTPESVAELTRVPARAIREAARLYASSKHAVILWGMGVTQFAQGVDVVKCLCSLALLTGNFGRPSTGVGPVRGQNNVQGTCDMGVLPDNLPGYQKVADEAAREKFGKAWGVTLPETAGLHLTRVPEAVREGKLRAYYILGEDPCQSDPNLSEMREAMEHLEFVIVQDIFMNKTGMYADVILPATSWGEHEGVYTCCDRGFQRVRKLVEPVGDVKTDWEIISLISTAMGYPMQYQSTQEIWDEMRKLCPKFAGATYEKLEALGGVQWPCYAEGMDDAGTIYLHKDGRFAFADGKAMFKTAQYQSVKEPEDEHYPLSLCTVREVGHYSVRTMTGNCRALRSLEDEPGWIEMSPQDCKELEITQGELVRVSSRRGSCITRCMPTSRVERGSTYMTYQWWIGACNELTLSHLDPASRTPEYKYCACRVEKLADQQQAAQEVRRQYENIRLQMGIEGGAEA